MSITETAAATSVAEVAHDLVELCRQHKYEEALERHYSQDIVSVESGSAPGMPAEMRGLDAIKGKTKWWVENHEIHSAEANGPFLGEGNQFAVQFKYDITQKHSGKRLQMNEMALYTVENGKVVHEHFFYPTGA
jgi:ketosteroid isomerase-like protein